MAGGEWWTIDDPAVFGPVAVEIARGEVPRHLGDYLYARWETDEYLKPGVVPEESLLLLDRDGKTIEVGAEYVILVAQPQGNLAGRVVLNATWQTRVDLGTSAASCSRPVGSPRLRIEREVLAKFLRSYGEDALAEHALVTTDEELDRIGIFGGHYAFSREAMAYGGSMGGARALSLAALDVLEGTDRDLRRPRSDQELHHGMAEELDEDELERIRVVRLTAPR